MRNQFPGHFRPTDAEFDEMWRAAVIVPDANILLHILRYGDQTRKEVLDTLRALKKQVWIPHRVGLEFLRNWREVDAENRAAYSKVRDDIRTAEGSLKAAFDRAARHQTIDAKAEQQKITTFVASLLAALDEAEQRHPDRTSAEKIVEEITALVGDAVGEKPSDSDIAKWIEEGKRRYEAKVPPGYKDGSKDGSEKYGDLFVWKELIAFCRNNGRPAIFITDDKKEDWALTIRGEQIGPRPELVEEFKSETGKAFYSYPLFAFLSHSKRYVEAKVSESTIAAIQKEQQDRIDQRRQMSKRIQALRDILANNIKATNKQFYIDESIYQALPDEEKKHINRQIGTTVRLNKLFGEYANRIYDIDDEQLNSIQIAVPLLTSPVEEEEESSEDSEWADPGDVGENDE